jgi:hypothetical protein
MNTETKDDSMAWNKGVPPMYPYQKTGETFVVTYYPLKRKSSNRKKKPLNN